MDVFIGSIALFAFNYTPPGWAQCNGQVLNINQNAALYALLGVFYGGNGNTNFALPDLRGRVAIGIGQGSGQPTNYNIGQTGGAASVTLTVANLAPHAHTCSLGVANVTRNLTAPAAGNILDVANSTVAASTSPTTVPLGGVMMQSVGQGQAFSILPPFLALNYCIATSGIFPSRS